MSTAKHAAPSKTITSIAARKFSDTGYQVALQFEGSKGTFSCNAYNGKNGVKFPLGTDCQPAKSFKAKMDLTGEQIPQWILDEAEKQGFTVEVGELAAA